MDKENKSKKIRDNFDLDSFFDVDEKTGKYTSKKITTHIKEENIDKFHHSEFYTDYSFLDSNKPKQSISYRAVLAVLFILIILIKIFL